MFLQILVLQTFLDCAFYRIALSIPSVKILVTRINRFFLLFNRNRITFSVWKPFSFGVWRIHWEKIDCFQCRVIYCETQFFVSAQNLCSSYIAYWYQFYESFHCLARHFKRLYTTFRQKLIGKLFAYFQSLRSVHLALK